MNDTKAASGLVIKEVTSPADHKAFIDLVYKLYANDPNFVPPLMMERELVLDLLPRQHVRHHHRRRADDTGVSGRA